MKATLTFNLPEENEEHLTAVQAAKWKLLAWELDQFLRGELKHNPDLTDGEASAMQRVRDTLREMASDHGLTIE